MSIMAEILFGWIMAAIAAGILPVGFKQTANGPAPDPPFQTQPQNRVARAK